MLCTKLFTSNTKDVKQEKCDWTHYSNWGEVDNVVNKVGIYKIYFNILFGIILDSEHLHRVWYCSSNSTQVTKLHFQCKHTNMI